VVDALPLHELEFDYLALVTPTSHTRFNKRYKCVMRQNPPPIIRDYVDDVAWVHATVKKRIATAFAKGWGVTVNEKPSGEDDMTNRHEENPAYCWRIGGNVTLVNGVCPECGWHVRKPAPCPECGHIQEPPQIHSKHKLVTMRTASRIPEKYIVAMGAGQSNFGPGDDPWETTAYDIALLGGGIENCNIVKYTSVIPKEAELISLSQAKDEGLMHHGMVLECIMAQTNGNQGQHICAGVGTFEVHNRDNELIGGFAVEYEGAGSPEKAQKMLAKSMDGLFKRRSYPGRGYHMRNKEFHIKDLVVDDKYGTVLVGLCFVSFVVPTF
jgi:arginine decarboxylase